MPSKRDVRTALMAVGLGVLGVGIGVAVWLPLQGGDDAGDQAQASQSRSAPASASSQSLDASGAQPLPGASSSARTKKPAAGLEVLPAPSSAPSASTGLPGLSKKPRPTTKPLITGAFPGQAAVAKGRLVPGYPSVLAPPTGQRITTSSVSPGGKALQVALTATCRKPCDPLKPYRLRLAERGFEETAQQGVENRAAAAFTRGSDSVVVTVTKSTRTSVAYTVFGVLHGA
ncbi:MAG: hypothetical protein J2O46_08685 [Nocardioides sp.]|nr:hypothetical protein [Nocardioides sp.]